MNENSKYSYQVFVNGLKISIRLGCGPEERKLAQSVQLDLAFDVHLNAAATEVDQTVCYLTASQLAVQLASQQEWALVENYLDSLCDLYFSKFSACSRIQGKLMKFVVPACDGAGVSIVRNRNL